MKCFGSFGTEYRCIRVCKATKQCRSFTISDGYEIAAAAVRAMEECLPDKDYPMERGAVSLAALLVDQDWTSGGEFPTPKQTATSTKLSFEDL